MKCRENALAGEPDAVTHTTACNATPVPLRLTGGVETANGGGAQP
jgi:hypothetical protein